MLNWDDEVTVVTPVEAQAVNKVLCFDRVQYVQAICRIRRTIETSLLNANPGVFFGVWGRNSQESEDERKLRLLAYKIFLRHLSERRSRALTKLLRVRGSARVGWQSTRSDAVNSRLLAPVAAPPLVA